jgi:hypothetical protein
LVPPTDITAARPARIHTQEGMEETRLERFGAAGAGGVTGEVPHGMPLGVTGCPPVPVGVVVINGTAADVGMLSGITWGGCVMSVGVGEGVAGARALAPVRVPCWETLDTFFMI